MRTLTRTAAVAALVVTTTVLGGCTPQDDPARPTGSTAADAQDPTRDEEATQPDAAAPSSDASNRVPVRSADLASATVAEAVPPVGVALPTLGVDVPVDPVGVEAALDPLPGWSATGEAVVEEADDGTRVLVLTVDEAAGDGFHEVWLIDRDVTRLVSLGVLEGSEGRFTVPAGLDLEDFAVVDVSEEPFDGDPAHSGDSIVRGILGT